MDVASHDGTNGLKLGGVLVTATAAELNMLSGYSDNDGAIAAQLSELDDVTISNNGIHLGNNPDNLVTSGNDKAGYNLGIGRTALDALTTGLSNIALGQNSLAALTTGDQNIAIGRNAMQSYVKDGAGNSVAIGHNALKGSLTGDKNTAVGAQAMQDVSDLNGSQTNKALENTAVGFDALGSLTYGDYNAAVGKNAGNIIRGGGGNTFVGSGANVPAGNFGANNRTAIGKSAIVSSNNTIQMGNDNVTLLKVGDGTATVTASGFTGSDLRFKDAIEPLEKKYGLQLINKLNPVTYNWLRSGKSDMGLIAQEVEKLDVDEIDLVGSFLTSNSEERLSVAYPKLVVPLIKAVQELSAEIDRLKKEITELKKESLKQ